MSTAREELLKLLARKSFRLGEFQLSSGGTSDYYIDCRSTTLDARGAQLVGISPDRSGLQAFWLAGMIALEADAFTAKPRLGAWAERMAARPSIKAALARASTRAPEKSWAPGPEINRWG